MNERRLLIVEESRSDAAALSRALASDGYATRRVPHAGEALRHLRGGRPPDLVLLSVAGSDRGWRTVRDLKERAQSRFVPLIALSARPGVDARVAGLRAGADDVLAKPWQQEEVLARVEALLRIKSERDALAAAKERLEQQSITDPLTGLFNRRYFEYRLTQEVERSRRHGEPLSLLMLDLDHFKHVNDRYGHGVGDDALRLTASLLLEELRRVDVCTRWGGEELAVIMPSTGAPGAAVVANRIVRALRARAVLSAAPIHRPFARAEAVHVTASLGLCTYPGTGVGSAEELVRRADAALCRAKAEGRNRVCASSPGGASRRPQARENVVGLQRALPRLAAVQ